MGRHGSDKGSVNIAESWHNYTLVYHALFASIRDRPLRVFELGLGTNNVAVPSNMGADGRPGASLRGWAEFFPRACVFGADIDADVLFATDRIQTFYCDQTDPAAIAKMWRAPALAYAGFDIIVEDGLHTFEANVCFFDHSIAHLNCGGTYVIEDILTTDIWRFECQIREWEERHPDLAFMLLTIPSYNTHDNTLLIVTRA
jgi:hypothetical protein